MVGLMAHFVECTKSWSNDLGGIVAFVYVPVEVMLLVGAVSHFS